MKKSVWISMIIAGGLILAGLACIAVGHGLGGHRILMEDALYGDHTVDGTHHISRDFDRIRIDVIAASVELIPSEDDKCRVTTRDSDYVEYTAYVLEDTLMIRATDTRRWYERLFTPSVSGRSVKVALPREEYTSLDVKTISGQVNINVRYTFSEDVTLTSTSGTIGTAAAIGGHLDMRSTSGDLYAMGFLNTVTARSTSGKITLGGKTVDGACTAATADLEATSGEIRVRTVTLDSLTAQTGSGGIRMESVTVTEATDLETTSGEITLLYTTCGTLTAETGSGGIDLTDTTVTGHIQAETTSGSIRFARADAETLDLKTTSGSVKGSLLTPKIFYTDTTSGSVDVPKSTKGGLCEIKTTSGSIHITIAE
jgi:DUF4097 and DUF4098 domain-containing protein YvlB